MYTGKKMTESRVFFRVNFLSVCTLDPCKRLLILMLLIFLPISPFIKLYRPNSGFLLKSQARSRSTKVIKIRGKWSSVTWTVVQFFPLALTTICNHVFGSCIHTFDSWICTLDPCDCTVSTVWFMRPNSPPFNFVLKFSYMSSKTRLPEPESRLHEPNSSVDM